MVHGNYYSVEYYIYLSKPLDYFDDILPICSDIRYLFEGMYSNNGLKIFDYQKFSSRFLKSDVRGEYIKSCDKISYENLKDRVKYAELFKYFDVKIYNKNKYDIESGIIKKIDIEEFYKLEKRFRELYIITYTSNDYSQELYKEMNEISKILDIQRIIIDDKYHEEIKMLESQIVDIELLDDEKEMLNKILNHPKLKGLIVKHGFELFCEYM